MFCGIWAQRPYYERFLASFNLGVSVLLNPIMCIISYLHLGDLLYPASGYDPDLQAGLRVSGTLRV